MTESEAMSPGRAEPAGQRCPDCHHVHLGDPCGVELVIYMGDTPVQEFCDCGWVEEVDIPGIQIVEDEPAPPDAEATAWKLMHFLGNVWQLEDENGNVIAELRDENPDDMARFELMAQAPTLRADVEARELRCVELTHELTKAQGERDALRTELGEVRTALAAERKMHHVWWVDDVNGPCYGADHIAVGEAAK